MKQASVILIILFFAALGTGCSKSTDATQPTVTVPPWDIGQSAEAVLGQSTLTGTGTKTPGAGSINNPWGLVTDNNGALFVVDQAAHRILRFDNATTKANGANADGVLGQPNFTSSVWN
ncbi:MAG: choice-of-anchor D domain-containing protein, partial [Bacteroidetes bacterium]|nr:choice-of-anchor D domain-containing protein [Bacteroidota bacterium]